MVGTLGLKAIFSADDKISPTVARMGTAIRGLSQASDGLGKLDTFNERITGGLKTAALGAAGLGTAVGLAAWDVVGSSARLEDSLAKVGSVVTPMSGTVVDATARMKDAAIGWSKAHRDSATDFLDSTYMMLSAGLNEKAAIEATRTGMAVATATFGVGADAASLLATVYNNMGDKTRDVGTEMSRLGDIITKTQQTFQFANLDQLNDGLMYGIPTAIQFGMSIDELSTVIGELNNAGLKGSLAGTAFMGTMRSMTKGAKELGFAIAKTSTGGFDFGGTLHNIEGKFGSLSKMSDRTRDRFQKAFGDEGFRGLSLLMGKSGEHAENLKKVHDSIGASHDAQAGIESKGTNRFKILGNNIDAVKESIGEGLEPAVDKVMGKLFGVTSATGEWTDANKQLISTKVTNFVDEAIPKIENFGHQLKEGWNDVAPILRGVGGAISWANDHGLSENIVKIGLGWAAFSGGVKVLRGGIDTVSTGLKAVRGVAGFLGETKDMFDSFRVAAGTAGTTVGGVSDALGGATKTAGDFAGGLGAAADGAGKLAGLRGTLNGAFDSWGKQAGLAAVAIGAIALAYDQASKLANESGGWEGIRGMFGIGTNDWGFEGMDEVMNRQAKQRRAAEDAAHPTAATPASDAYEGLGKPKGYAGSFGIGPTAPWAPGMGAPVAPGPWAGGYVTPGGMAPPPAAPPMIAPAPAITPEALHAAVSQALEVTIKTQDGTTAEVTKKPKGATVVLAPSGAP